MQRQPHTQFTYEQYAAMERLAEFRSEFDNGLIYAMAGTTLHHNELIMALIRQLDDCLSAKGCRIYFEAIRVVTPNRDFTGYPDLLIVCGKPTTAIGDDRAIVNPSTIIEVLSETTEGYDRSTKWARYRQIPTFTEYVLVAQDRPQVDVHRKTDAGWNLDPHTFTPGDTVEISGCPVDVAKLYADLS